MVGSAVNKLSVARSADILGMLRRLYDLQALFVILLTGTEARRQQPFCGSLLPCVSPVPCSARGCCYLVLGIGTCTAVLYDGFVLSDVCQLEQWAEAVALGDNGAAASWQALRSLSKRTGQTEFRWKQKSYREA